MSSPSLVRRHIERRELARLRAKARAEHPQPCDCALCIRPGRIREIIDQRLAAERERNGEPPF